MKRHFFAFFSMIVFTSSLCVVGNVYGQKFSFGFKGSVGMGWAGFGDKDQKDTFATKPILNYGAGFQIGFPLKNEFQLKLEGGYSREGRRLLFNDKQWDNRTVYNFVEAQMLLQRKFKFYLQKNVPSEVYFSIGPDINYWLNGSGRIVVNRNKPGVEYDVIFDETPSSDFSKMYYNNMNRWLFGLVLGVGIKAPLKKNSALSTDLRFVSGHTFLGKRNSSYIEILGYEDTQFTNLKSINLVVTYLWEVDVKEGRKGKSTLNKKLKKSR
ncbi:MAG TPA: outer membrane beta-barrel protein [Chryseosolibacter sp.]